MKSILFRLVRSIRRQLWAMVVAYMLGMHNFYTGEDKTSDDIAITIEYREVQENGTPKD
ncbi:MAG TPA: hypothetical protein VEW65_10540 [Chryseolinea sp.]|nr:hypothetical protein [Chryseolinea sp.]